MNKLGNLYFKIGNFDGAINSYKDGLEVERAVFDMCHPNIVVTLVNIGQIHKVCKEYPSALKYFKQALEIQRRSSQDPGISNTLSLIGVLYYQMHSNGKALSVYQEALRIRRDMHGDDHLDVASTINSIGLVLFKMDLHEYALQSFQEGARIRRKCLGPDHRDVATVYYNIGTVYLETGDDDEALTYYRETLRIERIALGVNHSDVAFTMQHIAHVHQKRGELDDALKLFTESLRIQKGDVKMLNEKEAGKKYHAAIAETLNHIGNAYLQRAKTDEMVKAYSESTRYLRIAGKMDDDLNISGLSFYGISKKHPECSPAA
jgi:tetratricopeptide (TPR) repeat protein